VLCLKLGKMKDDANVYEAVNVMPATSFHKNSQFLFLFISEIGPTSVEIYLQDLFPHTPGDLPDILFEDSDGGFPRSITIPIQTLSTPLAEPQRSTQMLFWTNIPCTIRGSTTPSESEDESEGGEAERRKKRHGVMSGGGEDKSIIYERGPFGGKHHTAAISQQTMPIIVSIVHFKRRCDGSVREAVTKTYKCTNRTFV